MPFEREGDEENENSSSTYHMQATVGALHKILFKFHNNLVLTFYYLH